MTNTNDEAEEPFYESKYYFDLSGATDDVARADGVADTAAAVAKLAGKGVFNAGLLAGKTTFAFAKHLVTNGPALLANAAERNLKENGHRMTPEQRSKAEEIIEKGRSSQEK
jgi:hypothetical protein